MELLGIPNVCTVYIMRQQILGADKLMAVGISSNRENNASQNGEVVLATCDGTVGLLMEPPRRLESKLKGR